MQSNLRIVWIYPDLLSTYGDQGNVLVLEQRARSRGIPVETVHVRSSDPVPEQGDIYLIGGGEDRPQILGAERLRRDGGLHRAIQRGASLLAVCAGYQIMGSVFGGEEGQPVLGIGLLDISSGRGERRSVGELAAEVDPSLGLPTLTGFENHMGVTTLGPGVALLSRTLVGTGNGDGTEGSLRRKDHRHLPPRPRPGAQPRPGRPAAPLGRRPAAADRRHLVRPPQERTPRRRPQAVGGSRPGQ